MRKIISMSDLHEHLNALDSDELILDVRTPEEYAEGHIPRSRNIPHEEVSRYIHELKKFKAIYIHCRSGKRAQYAAGELQKAGLNNLVCIGSSGMMDWTAAGYPIEKGSGSK
jgi:rhodanese-related sulfurtransferase